MIGPMDDDPLLAQLGDLLRHTDPVPPDVTLAARSAIAWRRMDGELAELLHDTALDAEPLAGVRGRTGGWRALTFEAPDGTVIEVEVSAERSRRSLIGQILPAVAARILLRFPGANLALEADDLGRFQARELRSGPVSLRLELPGGGAIETGWVTI